jgi:hypothetical protein
VIRKNGVEKAYSSSGNEEQRDRSIMHVPDRSALIPGAMVCWRCYGALQERRAPRETLARVAWVAMLALACR